MDLGQCNKIHDHALRADYEKAAQTKDYYYDVDAMEHLQNFINECDRRTEQSKRKLAETQEELSAEATEKLNRVHELAEQIGKKLAEAEKLGEEGFVEESLKAMEEVEAIKKQKYLAEQEYRSAMPAASYQQQKLRVCEVCSAYLGIHDNDRRLADHFGGKLHLGFITIRQRLEELKKSVSEKRKAGWAERKRDYEYTSYNYKESNGERERERRRSRERHSSSRHHQSSRSRSRSSSRHRRHRDHSEEDYYRNRRHSREDRHRDRHRRH